MVSALIFFLSGVDVEIADGLDDLIEFIDRGDPTL
jgi:hypothetical protein